MQNQNKYVHSENIHNLKDPILLVPEIIKILNPKSVVDIGCGLGNFLYIFKQNGINKVLGIDGNWVNKDLLSKYLSPDEFLELNLEEKFTLDQKYDLVISLEVAEHLSEKSAELFVQNLINSGNIILFSAAIPNQGGQNHVNEQWLTYWEEIFLKYNYILQDVIRPLIWNEPDIFWWYKQNMVLFTPTNFEFSGGVVHSNLKNVVHNELFTLRSNELIKVRKRLSEINAGKLDGLFYLKLLHKYLLNILNFNEKQ